MNIKQAIEALNTSGLKVSGRVGRFIEFQEALKCAISAMKELQMYKDGKLCLVPEDVYAGQCGELDAYKQLGTLEEVREALEKQKAKKPGEVTNGLIWWDNDGNPVWLTDHICAVCGKRIIPEYRHCPYCGQAIDWSEEKGDAG